MLKTEHPAKWFPKIKMAILHIICGKCGNRTEGVFNCGLSVCSCREPQPDEKWECLTCGKRHPSEREAVECDLNDEKTLLVQALDDGDIHPVYLETARQTKAGMQNESEPLQIDLTQKPLPLPAGIKIRSLIAKKTMAEFVHHLLYHFAESGVSSMRLKLKDRNGKISFLNDNEWITWLTGISAEYFLQTIEILYRLFEADKHPTDEYPIYKLPVIINAGENFENVGYFLQPIFPSGSEFLLGKTNVYRTEAAFDSQPARVQIIGDGDGLRLIAAREFSELLHLDARTRLDNLSATDFVSFLLMDMLVHEASDMKLLNGDVFFYRCRIWRIRHSEIPAAKFTEIIGVLCELAKLDLSDMRKTRRAARFPILINPDGVDEQIILYFQSKPVSGSVSVIIRDLLRTAGAND